MSKINRVIADDNIARIAAGSQISMISGSKAVRIVKPNEEELLEAGRRARHFAEEDRIAMHTAAINGFSAR